MTLSNYMTLNITLITLFSPAEFIGELINVAFLSMSLSRCLVSATPYVILGYFPTL